MEIKKEIEKLLADLKSLGITRKDIEAEFDYSENYIAQALSKGGNDKLLSNLKKMLARARKGESEYVEFDAGAEIKKIGATSEITLSAVAEVLAILSERPAAVVLAQLQDAVNKRLRS